MSGAARVVRPSARGTILQRTRAGLIGGGAALLAHLPAAVVDGLSDAVGEAWYRVAPGRAAIARGNLAHVVAWLADEGRGGARVRRAAADDAALERLVRAAFRHAARTYTETLRGTATASHVRRHIVIESPATVDAAFAAGGPAIYATPHFGSMAAVATVLSDGSTVPVTAPMEALDDPELQRLLVRAREAGGARIVGLGEARRELRAALARSEAVGLVADRDITGGGLAVPLFGLPAALPIGPAYLALDAPAPLHVAAVRRVKGGYRGWLVTLAPPPEDLPRRARIEALLAAEARAFEDLIAAAPEQWWTVFFPIWEAVGPRSHGDLAAARPAPGAPPSPGGPPFPPAAGSAP
jgi:lauroyl/myristoyl acyltransferase